MTNDTKQPPERIWAWPTYSWLSGAWGQTRFPETAESYTRTADALAAQGALIDRAAEVVRHNSYRMYTTPYSETVQSRRLTEEELAAQIEALSPDATAALEAVRREAVEQERARIITKVYETIHNSRHVTLGDKLIAAIRDTPPQET